MPIPSYLFAIVAGNIDKAPTPGKRTAVITEPEFMKESLYELEDMEN